MVGLCWGVLGNGPATMGLAVLLAHALFTSCKPHTFPAHLHICPSSVCPAAHSITFCLAVWLLAGVWYAGEAAQAARRDAERAQAHAAAGARVSQRWGASLFRGLLRLPGAMVVREGAPCALSKCGCRVPSSWCACASGICRGSDIVGRVAAMLG